MNSRRLDHLVGNREQRRGYVEAVAVTDVDPTARPSAAHSITSSAIAGSAVGMSTPKQSRMRPPPRGRHQLGLLRPANEPRLERKAYPRALVGESTCPRG